MGILEVCSYFGLWPMILSIVVRRVELLGSVNLIVYISLDCR
jgi:hypothetical protein